MAETINIPFTVGGGISSVEDVDILLKNGADKVSINSSAVKRPELINELVSKFGSQCIVVAIDAGHGGEDPGAIGANGTREKDVVLQISRRIYNVLKAEKGAKPVLIRTGDYFIPLATRRDNARRK